MKKKMKKNEKTRLGGNLKMRLKTDGKTRVKNFDKDIENSLTMDLEEYLREEDNNTDANNTRFQVPTAGLPRPGRKRQIFPINKLKGVGLALILGRRGMSSPLHLFLGTNHVRSLIKH